MQTCTSSTRDLWLGGRFRLGDGARDMYSWTVHERAVKIMPFLKTNSRFNMTWKDIWGYVETEPEVGKVARAFIAVDDLTTERELARMGA